MTTQSSRFSNIANHNRGCGVHHGRRIIQLFNLPHENPRCSFAVLQPLQFLCRLHILCEFHDGSDRMPCMGGCWPGQACKPQAAADPSHLHRSVSLLSLSVSSDIMDIVDWQRAAIAAANSIQLQATELMVGPFPHHPASMQVRRGLSGNPINPATQHYKML